MAAIRSDYSIAERLARQYVDPMGFEKGIWGWMRFCLITITAAVGIHAENPLPRPRLDVVSVTESELSLRLSEVSGRTVRLESATDLLHWQELRTLTVGAEGKTIQVPIPQKERQRFIRAVLVESAPSMHLAFVSPLSGSLLGSNRPVLELQYAGVELTPATLRLQANGTNLPVTTVFSEGKVVCLPERALPEGFVEVWAGVRGPATDTHPVARLELIVVSSTNNLPPAAFDDVAKTEAGQAVAIPVIDNDRDPNSDPVSISRVSPAGHGLTQILGGRIEYRPLEGFAGRDAFTYSIADGRGGSNSATVVVMVTPKPDLVVSVVEGGLALASGNRIQRAGQAGRESPLPMFLTLGEAVAHLCRELPPGGRGKVVIDRGGVIEVGILTLDCPVEIENRGGARFGGTNAIFEANAPLILSGFSFGGATFQVAAELDLMLSTFEGPAVVNLVSAARGLARSSVRPSMAGASEHHLNLVGNRHTSLALSGDTGGASTLNLERGQAVSLDATGRWGGTTTTRFERMITDRISLRAGLDASAVFEAHGTVAAAAFDNHLAVTGQGQAHFDATVAGEFELRAEGIGDLSVRANANRSDRASYSFATTGLSHTGTGNQHVEFSATFDTPAGGRLTASVAEDGLQVTDTARIFHRERTTVDLTLSASTLGGEVSVSGQGDLSYRVRDVEFGASLATTVEAGRTTAEIKSAKIGLGASYEFHPGAKLAVSVEKSLIDGAFSVHGPATDDFKSAVTDTLVSGGLQMAFDLAGSPQRLDRRNRSAEPRPEAGASPSSTRQAASSGEILLRNLDIQQPAGHSPFYPPTLSIRGARASVVIEKCRIDTPAPGGLAVALAVEETEAPVVLRDNTITGGELDLDGDTDSGPRQGLVVSSYTVVGNTIRAPEALNGIRMEDLKNVQLSGNTIEAVQALLIRAAQVTVAASSFPTFADTTAVLVVGQGRNGPGILRASGCDFASEITLAAGGFGHFSGNTFREAVLSIGSSGAGTAYAVCENNFFDQSGIVISPSASAIGYLKTSDNRFLNSSIEDARATSGGLVNNPVVANSGLDASADVTSPVDFDGNGCPDFPDDCYDENTGECACESVKPPPPEPAWPSL